MREVDYIVIHCSATPPTTKVSSILNYWKNNMSWKNVGYHRLIQADGTVHKLAPFEKVTNGVRGFNHNSIHISYIGGIDAEGLPHDTRTKEQKGKLLNCIQEALEWLIQYQRIAPDIVGHHDLYAAKACPSFPAYQEYKWITEGSNIALGAVGLPDGRPPRR